MRSPAFRWSNFVRSNSRGRIAGRIVIVFLMLFCTLDPSLSGPGANTASADDNSITYTSFDPLVIRANANPTTPVNFQIKVAQGVSVLNLELKSGEKLPLTAAGNGTFKITLTAAQVLAGYTPGYNHNVFGYLNEIVNGSNSRSFLVMNVLDGTEPAIQIQSKAADVQASAHLVNILMPGVNIDKADPAVAKRFYQFYPDQFDFLNYVYGDDAFDNRHEVPISNKMKGFGRPIFDNSSYYGSKGSLQGIIEYPESSYYDMAQYAAQHELGHQYINQVLPGAPHWPISEMAQGIMGYSLADGAGGDFPYEFIPNGDGNYTLKFNPNLKAQVGFSDLDLYLMGLLPADQVKKAIMFNNQNQGDQVKNGGILKGPITMVDANTIIASQGPRIPDAASSQKTFRVATIITTRNRLLNADEMAFFDYMTVRGESTVPLTFSGGLEQGTVQPFYLTTRKLGKLVTSIPSGSTPGIPPIDPSKITCFYQTNHCINPKVLKYWEQNGGLSVFGYPITEAQDELNRDTGRVFLTQWFERNRLEVHPENNPPFDTQLGRLGDDLLRLKGIDWSRQPRERGPQAGCLWFEQTGHNVCDQERGLGFKTYWEGHGLREDRLTPYERSLALFGLPLSAPAVETNSSGDRVITQWFERARFEWHPDKPAEFKVLLGLLGNEISANQR